MKSLLPLYNSLIEKGTIVLLIFTPFAFGTVQKWSVSLMEIGAFLLLIIFLLKRTIDGSSCESRPVEEGGFEPLRHGALKAASILMFLFVALVLLQLLPLPDAVLHMVSPNALRLYEQFGGSAASFHSISVNRYATRQELLLLLSYLSVFFVIIGHYRTKQQLRSLVLALFYIGAFLVLFALLQKVTWNGRMFWFYPIDGYLLKSKLDYIWGPFIYRNNFAGYLEMIIPLGLALLIYTAPGRKSSRGVLHSNRVARFLDSPNFAKFTTYFLIVLVMTAALFATLSRGGISACIASFIFFIWITRKRSTLRSRSLLLSLMALVVSAVVIFAAWDRIENRFEGAGYVDRATVWHDSLGIIRDYPLFGSGLGGFESTYLRYQSRYNKSLFDHAHNDYVEIVTDTGLVGTTLIGAALLLLLSALYRRWRSKRSTFAQCIGAGGLSAIAAMAVHSFTDFNLHIPAIALLCTVVFAITYVAVFNLSDHRSSSPLTPDTALLTPHSSLLTGNASRVVILLLAALLLYFPATSFLADYHYGRVTTILDDPATDYIDFKPLLPANLPDYLAAVRAAERAQALDPLCATYAVAVAEQYTRLGRWATALKMPGIPLPAGTPEPDVSFRQAELNLQSAIRLEPTNPDYHLALADIYEVYRKDPQRVDAELKLAVAAFPFNGAVRHAVTMHYLLAGRNAEALAQARTLAQNDDSYLLSESPQKAYTLDLMPRWYMDHLSRSYLFSSLEIAWRATRDPQIILSMVPKSREANNVLELFFDSKGMDIPE